MKGALISQSEVFAWLAQYYPELPAEADRAWVWLAVNLKDDQYAPVRKALSDYGFRYCGKGHALPSGAIGTWSHHCEAPIPFRRGKWRGRGPRDGSADGKGRAPNLAEIEAMLLGA